MRAVPSQVVSFIDKALYNAASEDTKQQVELSFSYAPMLRGLAELVRAIPDELLVLTPENEARFIVARSAIEHTLRIWESTTNQSTVLKRSEALSPVAVIKQVLTPLPDMAPAQGSHELDFIDDEVFRQRLLEDMGSVERAAANGEWKAATVLAGSVIEAVLLWALQHNEAVAHAAKSAPKKPLVDWDLFGYLAVAKEVTLITDETFTQGTSARTFRNLIHPGVERRKNEQCDRATAFAAIAAMDRVAREIRLGVKGQ